MKWDEIMRESKNENLNRSDSIKSENPGKSVPAELKCENANASDSVAMRILNGILIFFGIISICVGLYIGLVILALSGAFDAKHSWDVRKYIKENYAITGAHIRMLDKHMEELPYEHMGANGRIWSVKTDGEYPEFFVFEMEERSAWGSHYLCDDLNDRILSNLYDKFTGEKDMILLNIKAAGPARFIEPTVSYSKREEFERCYGQLKEFIKYLEENECTNFRASVYAVIPPYALELKERDITNLQFRQVNMEVSAVRTHMIQCAVYYQRIGWLEGIEESEIEEALQSNTGGNIDFMSLWEKR